MNSDTEEYPETERTNSEQDVPEYYEPEEQIEEESPLDEQNPLTNSEIIFGERRSHLPWTSFALDTEPEPEIDLERSFQALSLNDVLEYQTRIVIVCRCTLFSKRKTDLVVMY